MFQPHAIVAMPDATLGRHKGVKAVKQCRQDIPCCTANAL